MKESYLQQKLARAIFGMAANKSNIKLRLKHAYKECGNFKEELLSADPLSNDWQDIRSKLRSYGPVLDAKGNEIISSVENTVDYLSEDECVDIAQRMVKVFTKMLAREQDEEKREILSRF